MRLMNGLLTKTLYSLLVRGFFKKKNQAASIVVQDPGSRSEPEPSDHEDHEGGHTPSAAVDFDHLMHRIQACTRRLQRSCKKVDKDFLGIGERLQTIHGQAGNLTQKASLAVAQMGTDSADNVLAHITQTAGQALEGLRQKQTHIQSSLTRVLDLEGRLQKLQQMGDQLRMIARFLKMVGINISIESGRSEDGEEIFLALAKEIRVLAVTVNQVTRSFCSDTRSAHTHLAAICQEMHTKLNHFQALAQTAQKAIEHTAPIVQALINRSVDALAHVGQGARAISASVANIVMSLQIHDNVSQRVDHIAQALADAGPGREARSSNHGPLDGRPTASTALDAILALQIAQLGQVVKDVEDAYRVGSQAFEKISCTVAEIAQNMTLVGTDQGACTSGGAGASNAIETLKKTLAEISAMIGCGNDTVNELQDITRGATAAVSRIEQHMARVREVNFDIHLKSLNAMFKSMRLGSRGKAIEALVQEMKAVANQSNTFVDQVDAISSTILDAANALQDRFDDTCGPDHQVPEKNSGRLDAGIETFSAACTAFNQNAAETVALGHRLGHLIGETAAELVFIKTFARDLGTQLEQLKALRRQISPDCRTDHNPLSLKKAQITASYTMQQERDIHDRMVSRAADSTDAKAVRPPKPITEPDGEACHPTSEAASEALDDNIELF